MRQSILFSKTRRSAPSDEVATNAQLLIRAGFLHKEMAGVYTFLPLGLRVLNRINSIIREEMDAIGGQEMLLSTLQDKMLWEATNRWDDKEVDIWFKTSLQNDTELGLAFTHEEPITRMMREHVSSYRDLPVYAYQIQTKFRNEVRAKSGIMRTREFPMKDMYSFSRDEAGLNDFYEKAAGAYMRIFSRVGIGDVTYKTFSSGGTFSKFSHEFQTLSKTGEDIIFVDKKSKVAVNKSVSSDEVLKELGLSKNKLEEHNAIEVGNIFKLGTRFSKPLGLTYKDEKGIEQLVVMGSYGIGPSRVLGTIAETLADKKGLVWPSSVAPYSVHVVRFGDNERVIASADALVEILEQAGVEVLYDDRPIRPGEKFADSDLIGIPVRVVVSDRTVESGTYEVVLRKTGEVKMQSEEELLTEIA